MQWIKRQLERLWDLWFNQPPRAPKELRRPLPRRKRLKL